jgi:hypothetical protein
MIFEDTPMLPFIPVMRGGQEEQMFRRGLAWLWGEPTLAELELLLAFFASFVLDTPFIQRLTGWILGWCPSIACIKWLRSDIGRSLIEPVVKVRGHTIAQQLLHGPHMVRHPCCHSRRDWLPFLG